MSLSGEPRDADRQVNWARQDWFAAQAKSGRESQTAYFAHERSGYQRYRHARVSAVLAVVADGMGRETLLDIGCATGALTARIARQFGFSKAIGMDFVPEVLDLGRGSYPEIDFRLGTLPRIDIEAASADVVIASEVLYYLTPEGRAEAIDEVARVLRPGGILLFTAVLGGRYFSVEEAKALIGRRLDTLAVETLHMAWFHRLAAPVYFADRLYTLIRTGGVPASAENRARYDRLRRWISPPPMRWMVGLTAAIGQPLLRREWPPRVCDRVLRLGRPTNIVIAAARPKD